MSSGNWNLGESKERVGLFNRFMALANSKVTATQRGVVGIPLRADWGPENKIVICSSDAEIVETFGTGGTVALARRAMRGSKKYKPNKVVIFRMASAEAACATAKIGTMLKLTAKYTGTRGNNFKASISVNLKDDNEMDLKLYEDSTLVSVYTAKGNDIKGLAASINADKKALITAEKLADGELTAAADIAFAGGISGSTVSNKEYVAALDAFEATYLNTLAMDGITSEDLMTTIKNWHYRVWNAGKMIQLVVGGTHEDDADPEVGNQRSKLYDHYGIVNCIVGGIDSKGVQYSSAEMAPQIAGAVAALPLNKSITYKELDDIVEVTTALSDTQISEATAAGSFVLIRDVNPETLEATIKVERGINTYTSFTQEAGSKLRKIKAISTMSAIDYDIGKYAVTNILGEIDNDADGRAFLFSGISKYLETLAAQKVISKDILVGLSNTLTSEEDIVYMETQALTIDKIEQIFNTIYL